MSQREPERVCSGAPCRCDQGTLPMPLHVTSQQTYYQHRRPVATSQDKTFAPFGTCQRQNNQPCTPQLLDWQQTLDSVMVEGPLRHLLVEHSTIRCERGGTVSVVLPLQLGVPSLPAPPQVEGVRTAFMSLCPLLLNED